MNVKPFSRQGRFTAVDNAIFDEIMPSISTSEWMILSLIIRKTIGWQKDTDGISYSQFIENTNIKSNTTVKKAVDGLLEKGLIQLGKAASKTEPHYYRLNKDYTVRITENVERPITFSVEQPPTENVDTKESIKKNNIKKDIAAFAAPPPPMQATNGTHKANGTSGNSTQPPGSAAPPSPKKELSEHQQLMKAYQDCLGYPIANGAKEAVAAKWILNHGYTVQQAIDCYHQMKKDSFWCNKPVSLQSVKSQLGEFVKNGSGNGRFDIESEWQSIKLAAGQPGKPNISENALRAVHGVSGGWRRFKEQDVRFFDQLKSEFKESYERANKQPATA